MANIVYPVISVIFLVFISSCGCHKDIGEVCTLLRTGANGVCKLLSDCSEAIHDLQMNKIHPQMCGFQGSQVIVCCVKKGSVVNYHISTTTTTTTTTPRTTTTPTTTTTRTTTTTTKRPPKVKISKVGDISRAKCKEYSQYYKTEEDSPILIPGAEDISNDDCPIVPIELIVGGEQTKPKEFPHMALIGFDGEDNVKTWLCGGSLISELYVLTAAHCLYNKKLNKTAKYIRIGELSLSRNDDDAYPQDFEIVDKIIHPGYKQLRSQYNDIALLKLDRPAILNPYARPACLDVDPVITVPYAVATGWGEIGNNQVSNELMKVTLEFFTTAQCNYTYRSNIGITLQNGIIEKSQVCAGSHTVGKDTCLGDSGGPLQIVNQEENCMYTIVGLTSFGKACGYPDMPGVYTRVSNYIDWIESNVWS